MGLHYGTEITPGVEMARAADSQVFGTLLKVLKQTPENF